MTHGSLVSSSRLSSNVIIQNESSIIDENLVLKQQKVSSTKPPPETRSECGASTRRSEPGLWSRDQESAKQPTWIRNAAIGGDLVEQDPKGPDVGLVGEFAVADGLRGGPLVRNLLVFGDVERLLQERWAALMWMKLSRADQLALVCVPTLMTRASPKSPTLQV